MARCHECRTGFVSLLLPNRAIRPLRINYLTPGGGVPLGLEWLEGCFVGGSSTLQTRPKAKFRAPLETKVLGHSLLRLSVNASRSRRVIIPLIQVIEIPCASYRSLTNIYNKPCNTICQYYCTQFLPTIKATLSGWLLYNSAPC